MWDIKKEAVRFENLPVPLTSSILCEINVVVSSCSCIYVLRVTVSLSVQHFFATLHWGKRGFSSMTHVQRIYAFGIKPVTRVQAPPRYPWTPLQQAQKHSLRCSMCENKPPLARLARCTSHLSSLLRNFQEKQKNKNSISTWSFVLNNNNKKKVLPNHRLVMLSRHYFCSKLTSA